MAYQTFPWEAGDSRSFEKLAALYLPDLGGKSVLDVGCNAGLFCGWARFQGADRVVGIDSDSGWIGQARTFFPDCEFFCQSWDNLGPEQFDVILFLSAIHYAKDQRQMLDLLMSRLAPDGVLILEIGVAPGAGKRFVPVERAIDTRFFPTQAKLLSMLEPYAFKRIGPSADQDGDPVPRQVYHVSRKKPVAVLLMDGHYSGKSSLAGRIFNPDLAVVGGDALYYRMREGQVAAPEQLLAVLSEGQMNCAAITDRICRDGLLEDLCAVLLAEAKEREFVLDMYIPPAFRAHVAAYFQAHGYFVGGLSIYGAERKSWSGPRPGGEDFAAYLRHLQDTFVVDEQAYLAANPDVALAVAKGQMPSGQYHYWNFGRLEGRPTGSAA